MHFPYLFQRFILLIFAFGSLTGCMVGPNFFAPPPPQVPRYTQHPLPAKTVRVASMKNAGKAQRFIDGMDIPGAWWRLFHSPEINDLVTRGIANSPNLAAAKYALIQAHENLNVTIGNLLLPAVDGTFSAQRGTQAQSNNPGGGTSAGVGLAPHVFDLFNASINVTYVLDVFGGSRRQVEAAFAQVDFQKYQLIAAYLTLTSNIVTTAITVASLDAQIRATRELIKAQSNTLHIFRKQFNLGGIPLTDVLTQETLVDQTRATLPPLQKSLAQALHALDVLVGDFPDCPIPRIKLEKLRLPPDLPVTIPSFLVCQRPDVQAAQATLHQASAQIGVAIANLLPQFQITGLYGYGSTTLSHLFSPQNLNWSIMNAITQPLFHGGALLAARRLAIAAYKQAGAQYQETVLVAFQNVADSLRAIETDARTFRDQRTAEVAAKRALNLTSQQFKLGGVNYIALLNAQQQYQQTLIARVQAQAARYTDTAALFQALGGGWWNRSRTLCHCL